MLIDITLPVTPEMAGTAWAHTDKSLVGHLGTHFDVMDKEFPLEYTERPAVVFDVSGARGREIGIGDIDLRKVEQGMFVALRTGFIEEVPYGTPRYFKEHPQLSRDLIDALLDRKIALIGVDQAGIVRGSGHVPADQRCADRGVFVIENLWGLDRVLEIRDRFTARTFPVRFSGVTGLPCRVVAEL